MEDKEKYNLATELLHEIKASARRWFIAFLIMCGAEIATIAGFLYFISLPAEEYYIEQDADNRSFNNVSGGDFTNGGEAENIIQEEK